MDYIQLDIAVADEESAQIVVALLSDLPFEGFSQEQGVVSAYMEADRFAEYRARIGQLLDGCGGMDRTQTHLADRNWNRAWEQEHPPVHVDGRLLVRAPMHEPAPEGVMEVIVEPDMAFGTGHHATTRMMTQWIFDLAPDGKRVLDLGCGTGVLAILALRCGARQADAVDCDRRAVGSTVANARLNGVQERIRAIEGDMHSVEGERYDLLLANICRNVLLDQMPLYAAALVPGGRLVVSGFLEPDGCGVAERARCCGLVERGRRQEGEWVSLCFAPTGERRDGEAI